MNADKSFFANYFCFNEKQKIYLLSFVIHLAIILIFFTTPASRNISEPQIISVTMHSAEQMTGRVPDSANAPSLWKDNNDKEKKQPVSVGQAAVIDKNKQASAEESKLVLISEKDISAPQKTANEHSGEAVSVSTVKSDGAISDMSQNVVSGIAAGLRDYSDLAALDSLGTEGAKTTNVTEARFGERGAPSFLYQEIPVYPMLARRLGKEGRVLLKLLIDADGKLSNIEVIEAAGYGFTEASVAAVKKSTYLPGYRDGIKVATRALLPISFRLQ